MKRILFVGLLWLVAILGSVPASAQVVISEFMANNDRVLLDEDGQSSDWLELNNTGATSVNLAGYFLTDDALTLTKWAFPPVTLPPGGFLVVFASGKNRTEDPARLHTSFQLSADGGYLALVKPDGTNIASAFTYPTMKEDVAFGIAQSVIATSLLANSAPRVLVPTHAADLPADWNQLAFSPGANWLTGVAPPAVGYDTNLSIGAPVNVATSGTAVQSTVNGSFAANLAINGNLGDFTHTLGSDMFPFWQVTLTNEMSIFSVVLFNRTSCCGSRLRDITIEILSTNAAGMVTNFTSALLNPENTGFTYPNGPAYLSNNLVSITGGPVSGRIVRVRRTPDPDGSGTAMQGNTDETNVLSLAEVVINASAAAGLHPYFNTDLQTNMLNVTPSAFVRVPFTNSGAPDSLTLNARYDDGFVAYLNGVEIARRNAPGPAGSMPTWNSTATADRNFASATTVESINVSAGIPALVSGANVLAVQLLNVAATSADLLFQPELIASRVSITPNVFFDDATPGAPNTTDWYYAEVDDTHLSVDRGFFDAPFSLSITSGTPDAVIYYSFNSDEPGPGKGFLYTNAISITNTTVLRTRAFKTGWKATDVDTATYIFLNDVIYQVPNWPVDRIPPRYFPATWGANSVDYGMDPEIVTNYTLAQWREALTQIPTLSIVTEMGNLFDAATGIYANASQHGEEWERPASLELIDPTNAVPGRFQENCGLRIRGGFSRNADFRKHSFRLYFRRDYGAGKLNYPLFENEGAQEFETFDLRTSQNYSWPRGTESPTFETMVREVFCRKTLGDMGQPYRRSRYYHLYLNGQYWGLYETDERPEASFGESYFGGSKTNFDVVKCGNRGTNPNFATEATDGNLIAWSNLWVMTQIVRTNATTSNYFRILGANPDGTRNPSLPVMVDVDNLIDYMLEIFYSGDGDATLSAFLSNNQPNNWFGMRDRTNPDVGFRFFNSDCEHTLGSPSSQINRTGPFPNSNEANFTWSNPQWMHEELSRNAEYRLRFADHVQKHFFNGGALTLEACTNRFIAKASQITKAIRAYSARWGDANSTIAYGESHWTNALAFVLNWFPPRAALVLTQLRSFSYGALFPSVGAPSFSQLITTVPEGYNLELSHTNASGVIFYTLDGSDPRLVGGAVSPAALAYSLPITINAPTFVRARVLTGTNWSAIIEAIYQPPQNLSKLLITEIMYHPPAAGLVDGDEFEFVELKNTGTATLNLSNLRFTGGITFNFTNSTFLGAGQFFVLVRNPTQFTTKYPGVAIGGVYSGRLDNAGENLRLTAILGGTVQSINYDDRAPWPAAADGFGFSLVPLNPNANPDPDNASNWRASTSPGGSPGMDDPPPASLPPIFINEALTASVLPDTDKIELFNPTASTLDLGGWFLTDEPDTPKKYRIPTGTMIDPGAYLTFDESQFNAIVGASNSFSLRAEGDDLYLYSADASGNLTGYSHGFSFGAAAPGVSFGRHVNSVGEEDFTAQIAGTFGGTNTGPRIGPVVINEIMYHPQAGEDEFIELRNISGSAVDLFDPATPTNTWRLNGLGFDFPTNVTLGTSGLLLIVPTDPAAFRTKYLVPAAVPILGPYSGALQDSGERLELQRPGPLDTNSHVAYINVDMVRYNDKAPWAPAADGSGPSLQRKNPFNYGNEPMNWEAAVATPGRVFTSGTPPTITLQPMNVSVVATREAMFTVAATGPGPLYYQWRFNGVPLPGATNTILFLANLQLTQSGNYSLIVYNSAGSTESSNAVLTVLIPAQITQPPADVKVRIKPDPAAAPMTNATFQVSASSTTPLRYQWRFAGTNLPNLTNNSLTITNVQLANGGEYQCAITDNVGTIFTTPVKLIPLITPVIVQPPLANTVPQGGLVGVSVVLGDGNPPPFYYEWRRGSAPVARFTNTFKTNAFTFLAPTNVGTTLHRLIVTNLANISASSVSAAFDVITIADTDHDGMSDAFELANGLNANDASDAMGDPDGDKMTNLAESLAGTDPSDPNSYLRVDQNTAPGSAVIRLGAIANRTYSIQYSTQLPAASWSKLADIAARTTNHVETIADPNWSSGSRFYRVVTPTQP